jgi:hypothetical protein
MNYNAIMAGKLHNRGIPDKVVVSFPRKGGQKIKLKPVDRKQAFALILQQNKGKCDEQPPCGPYSQ